jgi:hypothetical protein
VLCCLAVLLQLVVATTGAGAVGPRALPVGAAWVPHSTAAWQAACRASPRA